MRGTKPDGCERHNRTVARDTSARCGGATSDEVEVPHRTMWRDAKGTAAPSKQNPPREPRPLVWLSGAGATLYAGGVAPRRQRRRKHSLPEGAYPLPDTAPALNGAEEDTGGNGLVFSCAIEYNAGHDDD